AATSDVLATWAQHNPAVAGALQRALGRLVLFDPIGGNSAISHGDPHLISADGASYDFQATGDFVFARALDPNELEIHIRYLPYSPNISVTDAVAARVHGNVVELYPNGSNFDVVVDGTAINGTNALTQLLSGGGALQVSSGAATIAWPDRTTLMIRQGVG